MKGFFIQSDNNSSKTRTARTAPRGGQSKAQASILFGCQACGLDQHCQSPKMPVTGEGRRKILIIAEAPGKTEDEEGVQLIGQAGQVLRSALRDLEIDLDQDCWKTNAIRCRPEKNRTPTSKEIKLCRSKLFEEVDRLFPEKIILLGRIAVESYFGEDHQIGSMEHWTGWAIPDWQRGCIVFPTYHPSYILRDRKNDALRNCWIDDLEKAVDYEYNPPMKFDPSTQIILDEQEATKYLNDLLVKNPEWLAFDYETTGLRSNVSGAKIHCVSIAIEPDFATVFRVYDGQDFRRALRRVLQGPSKKIAHNIKYETIWTRNCLGYSIKNWGWDSMLAAHVLDNRQGITGLKWQLFARYGIHGYDKEIQTYLRINDNTGINRIDQANFEMVAEYCGYDAVGTFRLAMDQMGEMSDFMKQGNSLLLSGAQALASAETNGIAVNVDYFTGAREKLKSESEEIEQKIQDSPEADEWRKTEGKHFNPNSDPQLKRLLFEILGYKSDRTTDNGNPSTDQEALEKLNSPFCRDILRMRKINKLVSTYIGNYVDGSINGRIYPFFNLNKVKTYRSSSDSPNFQNIPKRDDESQRIIRSGIIPSKGHQLLEVDYSGVEVRISACYHKDPEMLRYINDPKTDMHRDMATEIFVEDIDYIKENKHLRQAAKNGFVFPQFYGDYFINCAHNIWDGWMKPADKQRIKNHGIKTIKHFEEHIKKIEDDFWNKKFRQYTEWKKKTWDEYLRRGYVELLTGFRCGGLMKKNDALNYPIQGAAFHCLLWSLIQITDLITAERLESRIVGQIHDSIIIDLVPEESEFLFPRIKRVMCEDIRKEWPWIIVPLDVEAEISEVDGNWYNKKVVSL